MYPTDTIWGIGCDATNSKAVEKIFRIKERLYEKSLIILVKDLEMMKHYVSEIPDIAIELLASVSEPITIIYPNAKNLPKNVIAHDGSIAIRIPKHDFCQELLEAFQKPITSTSANITGGPMPYSFRAITDEIKVSVQYVVQIEKEAIIRPKASTIVKIEENGELRIIRN